MIRHPERVKAECLRPLSESEEVCPARGLTSHGAFDGRQVNANFERAQGPRRPIHTCLGGPGRLLVISHDDSPYLLPYRSLIFTGVLKNPHPVSYRSWV